MQDETESRKPLLTVSEVSGWLNISASLVYQLVDLGKLPVHRIGNGRGAIRFRQEDIEEYLEASRSENVVQVREPSVRPKLKHVRIK